eukprot:403365870
MEQVERSNSGSEAIMNVKQIPQSRQNHKISPDILPLHQTLPLRLQLQTQSIQEQSQLDNIKYLNSLNLPSLKIPQDLSQAHEMSLQAKEYIEADQKKRHFEYDLLKQKRQTQLNINRQELLQQKQKFLAELAQMDIKMREDENSYTEIEMREGYLFEEKIQLIKVKREKDFIELYDLQEKLSQEAKEKEDKRMKERERRELEEKAFEDIVVQARQKREQIMNYQEILYQNAQEQQKKQEEIEIQRKEQFMKFTLVRKKIDYEQVQSEANHLRKEVENDFLEREIQERINRAKLQLNLSTDKIDAKFRRVDQDIQRAQILRGTKGMTAALNQTQSDWSMEEDALWDTYKQRLQQEEENNKKFKHQQQQQEMLNKTYSDFDRSENGINLDEIGTPGRNYGSQKQQLNKSQQNYYNKSYQNNRQQSNAGTIMKQMTIYEEMRLADDMISQLSQKISNFGPKKHGNQSVKNGSDKLMQRAFNRNGSQINLQNQILLKGKQPSSLNKYKQYVPNTVGNRHQSSNKLVRAQPYAPKLQTAPNSPNNRGNVMTSHLNKSEINAFIRNHKQVQAEKQYERQKSQLRGNTTTQLRNLGSAVKSARVSPTRPVFR